MIIKIKNIEKKSNEKVIYLTLRKLCPNFNKIHKKIKIAQQPKECFYMVENIQI